MSDCEQPEARLYINGRYVDPAKLAGPSDEEVSAAYASARRRTQAALIRGQHQATCGQGSADIRRYSPRAAKYGSGRTVLGVRMK